MQARLLLPSLSIIFNHIDLADRRIQEKTGDQGHPERITMEKYLIETPHSAQDCKLLVDQIYAMGYLYHFDWGCKAGVHSGWAIIEAEDEAQARLVVPSIVRRHARVVKLNKFAGNPDDEHLEFDEIHRTE